ncbi:hemerythrin domain-containing protein [uncultured Jatrophihabitans sp.]|uniref:hemerythrin domain-containing protein n=1 Tax=uncultured Jatrophihabitans sp. TaxID=1610747 RepID=UPI0035CAE8EB
MTPTTHSDAVHTHTNSCWWNSDEARWVCPHDAAAPLVDVRDMIVVHTAMLREFRLAPAAVRRVAPGSAKGAAAVERHLAFVCDMLHHHHQGEDELLWPLLRERAPAAAAVLDQVESQHADIDAALDRVAYTRQAWAATPDAERRETLALTLERLHALLAAHLDLEESAVLPVAAGVLTDAEWGAVGAAAAASMSKPALVLAIGMFAYEGDPAVLRTMLSHAPAVPRFVVPRIGPRAYARRARQVHGTARP